MGLLDTVAGLELDAVKGKYGIYLKCDLCGATLDAERVNVGTDSERIGSDEAALQKRAWSLGWSGTLDRSNSGIDRCPDCSNNTIDVSGQGLYAHEVGNAMCEEGWCDGGCAWPKPCKCGGLIHAEFRGEETSGKYSLHKKCDRCGEAE